MNEFARPMALLLRVLAIAAMLTAVFFLLPLGIPYVENPEQYALVRRLMAIDKQCMDFMRSLVPLKISGHDVARGILVALAVVVSRVFSRLRMPFVRAANVYGGTAATEKGVSGAAIAAGGIKSRAALLEIMAETKKKLDSMQRDLAFLSIDVVGSTDMKMGEDRNKIEMDFREYKKFIDGMIAANGALTAAWTPDGVMICFPSADAAITTAQSVIAGLQGFNKNVKTIRALFRVRCGVNAGHVYYDRSIPMEQMSDHVIDVAGHMQKYALPNTVALPKPVVAKLSKREGFRPAGKEVDGFEVYQWGK
jgi:class 3 adenylate cyclase